MPQGPFLWKIFCKRAPLICPQVFFFWICCKRAPLICPQGPLFWILCKRAHSIFPQGPFLFEYVVKGFTKYSRRGLLGEIFDKLRIQCRMHFFEKMPQNALNQVLTLPDYRAQKMLQIPLKIIDLQNDFNMLVAKRWKIRISVPMSYISFWE